MGDGLKVSSISTEGTSLPSTGTLGVTYSGDDVDVDGTSETEDHIADTTDAHDASAISIADAGGFYAGANVEAALQEAAAFAGSPNLDGGIASSTYGGIAALDAGGA